jgi:phosphohistidine phosphatase SixA
MTMVLLVRHAEYCGHPDDPPDYPCNPSGDDPDLGYKGGLRAQELAHVGEKAGVEAIYTTDKNRTKQTVRRVADKLGIEATVYTDTWGLVYTILSEHDGDVVLVAGHSPTVPEIIDALGGNGASCEIGNEYDNLCVLTIHTPEEAKVVNLQYGEPSP